MNRGILIVVGLIVLGLFVLFGSVFTVNQTQQALVLQLGEPVRMIREPGLKFKLPFIQNVTYFDKRILSLDAPPEEIIAADQRRLVVDSFARFRIVDVLKFFQTLGNETVARSRLASQLNSALRRVLGSQDSIAVISGERAQLMTEIARIVNVEAARFGIEIIDVRIKRADYPDTISQAIFRRMQTEREREAKEIRAQGFELSERIRADADRQRTILIAEARRQSEVDFWYTDKDSVTAAGERRVNLLLKPDWSPEMMFSVNYLTHLDLIRTRVLREIGGWNGETDGAQDWDLFLRVAEHGAVVARAAGVLYHWRIIAGSTSTGVAAKPYVPKAQLRTLQGYVDRLGLPARLEPNPVTGFRLRWPNATGTGLLLLLADPAMFDATAVTRAILLARRLCLGRDMRLIVCATATEVGLYAEADGDVQIVTGTDLAEAVTRAVAEHAAATVTLLSSGVTAAAGDLLAEHTGWLAHHREIAFVTSLVFDRGGKVMEAGCAVDARPVAHPMFRGDERTTFGWFGSPSWYRNCRAASPIAVTFRRDDLAAALAALPPGSADIGAMTTAACLAAVADGRRGLVNPHSWVRYGLDVPEMPEFDDSVGQDPFFHPAFAGVSPLVLKTN